MHTMDSIEIAQLFNDGEVDGFAYTISEMARKLMRTGLEGLGITPIEEM